MARHPGILLLLASLLLGLSSCVKHSPPEHKKTTIAFSYHKKTDEDIRYLSRFDLIVTGDIEKEAIAKNLKKNGAKLIMYDWLPATYYCKLSGQWEKLVYKNRFFWTLDPDESAPNPMGAKNGCLDLFYDMANDELLDVRAEYLVGVIRKNNYDGVFFDWGSGWHSLVENNYRFLTDEFKARHPAVNYDDKVNDFIKRLKDKGLIVIMNGGFRSENGTTNKYADFDIVESMFTTTHCDAHYDIHLRDEHVLKACDTWFNTTTRAAELSLSLPERARRTNPNVDFMFLDYAFPYYQKTRLTRDASGASQPVFERSADRQAIFYSLANTYLGNAVGFTNGPDVSLSHVKDDIFLFQIGAPLGPVQKIGESAYARFFTRGFVVVGDHGVTLDISLPKTPSKVVDLFSGQEVQTASNTITISLSSLEYPSGVFHPVGRIFSY